MTTERIDIIVRERGSNEVRRDIGRIGQEAKLMGTFVDQARAAILGLGAALSVQKLIAYSDELQTIQGKLRIATSTTEGFVAAQRDLFNVAQSTRSSFGATVDLYTKLASSTEGLSVSQAQLVRVTETVNKTLAISGATAEQAKAVVLQFGQGLAAGALRGEELNSVLEGSPRLARALAEGLGYPVGALKQLAEQGALTSERIIAALQNQSKAINDEFGQMPLTISQSFTLLNNELVKFVGTGAQTSGAASALAGSIQLVAQNLEYLTAAALGFGAAKLGATILTAMNAARIGVLGLTAALTGATVAGGTAATALGLLGGPIGIITTLLGLGVTAWFTYKAASSDAAKTAAAETERSTADIIAGLDKQIAKLQERNKIAAGGFPELPKGGGDEVKRLAELQGKIGEYTDGTGRAEGVPEVARQAVLQSMLKEYAALETRVKAVGVEQEKLDAAGRKTKAAEWMEKYADKATKLKETLAKARKELGDAFTPDLEKRIRATFDTKDGGTKQNPFADEVKSLREKQAMLGLDTQLEKTNAEIKLGNYGKLSIAQADELRGIAKAIDARSQEIKWLEDAKQTREAVAKAVQQVVDKAAHETDQLKHGNEELEWQIQTLGLTEQAVMALERARVQSTLTMKLEALATETAKNGVTGYSQELENQVLLLRQRDELLGKKSAAQATVDEADKRSREVGVKYETAMSESIAQGMMDGFRRGESLADVFLRELKAQFAKTVLTPLIQPQIAAGNELLGDLLRTGMGFLTGGRSFAAFDTSGAGTYSPRVEGRPVAGLATGTNYVPYDGMPAVLHEGEAVVPKKFNPAAGGAGGMGGGITYAPVFAPNIDSRTDRAAIRQEMVDLQQQSQEQFLQKMRDHNIV